MHRIIGSLLSNAVFPALPAHGISKAIEAVADDSVDPLHTRSGKYLDKLLGDGLGH
jgi:hypothetical protein